MIASRPSHMRAREATRLAPRGKRASGAENERERKLVNN